MADPRREGQTRWRPKVTLAEAEMDGERVLWDPESGRVARLDRIGSLIWGCLDGETGVEELCDDLGAAFNTSPDAIRGDVDSFMTRLSDMGFLVTAPNQPI